MKRILAFGIVTIILVAAGVLVSAQIDLTTFTPGDPILAAEVNANFNALADAVTPLQDFADNLFTGACAASEAINAVAVDGTPTCVAVSGGAGLTSVATDATLNGDGTAAAPLSVANPGLTSVATDATLNGDGTAGSTLSVSVPLALTAGSTEALELTGAGTGISNATLRASNTGGGIGGWIEQTQSGSSDTSLGLSQSGTGPFLKMFGPNGGNEEVRIASDGTIFLFQPGAISLNDFNIKLDNANGNITAAAFNTSSDAALKSGFAAVDPVSLLEAVVGIPVTSWHFLDDPDVVHIGPTAQDFWAAFGLGQDDRHIATVDADGVALAAIQGLYQLVQEKDALISEQKALLASLEARLSALEEVLAQTTE